MIKAALRNSYGYAHLKSTAQQFPLAPAAVKALLIAQSVLSYDASGAASVAYKTLAKEVENERSRQQHHTPLDR